MKYKITKPNKGWFENQGKNIEKECQTCGATFKSYLSTRDRKYCSLPCYRKSCLGKKRPEHSKKLKDFYKINPHPSTGRPGIVWSDEHKKKLAENMRLRWKDKNNYLNSDEYKQIQSDRTHNLCKTGKMNTGKTNCHHGYYDINGKNIYFRSGWEPNYALYLDYLVKLKQIINWEYEVDTFWFESIKRGVRSYKPDFKIHNNNGSVEYHEVKGWMDSKSKTKLSRMKKYYPKIKMVLIDESSYKDIRDKLGKTLKFY